uniref:Cytochrome c oxidase assembly factor 7 n=1 Tax=Salmo trutta TaxID=8032 RepID=A0A673YRE6_SALTR
MATDEKEVKQYLDDIGVEFSYQWCQRLADYIEGVKENVESTTQVLKHNCEMNKHGEGFYKLGVYYVQGKGEIADNLKMAYSSRGKKSVDACQNAGPEGERLKDSLMCWPKSKLHLGWNITLWPFSCVSKMMVQKNTKNACFFSLYYLLPDLMCYILLHSFPISTRSVFF